MNKKDKNSLVQYYKSFRPVDYKNQRLEPREVFYIELIEAIADLYLKRQKKFEHQTLELKSDEVMKLAWRIAGYLEDGVPPLDLPEPLLESPDTAIFYVVDKGINFLTGFREFLKALDKKGQDLTEDDEEAIYGYVTESGVPYQLFHHLKKDYSFESVKCAFRIKEWNEERYLEFLLRRYKGRQYKEKFPDLKLISIEG